MQSASDGTPWIVTALLCFGGSLLYRHRKLKMQTLQASQETGTVNVMALRVQIRESLFLLTGVCY